MSAVAFSTGRKLASVGYPKPARACGCGCRRLVHDMTCCRCGFLPQATVSATWARQAERVALRRVAA